MIKNQKIKINRNIYDFFSQYNLIHKSNDDQNPEHNYHKGDNENNMVV